MLPCTRAQCIVAMLPFLDDVDDEDDQVPAGEKEQDGLIQLNAGEAGISRTLDSALAAAESPAPPTPKADEAESAGESAADIDAKDSQGSSFINRRLSVSSLQYDDEDDE